MEQSQQAARYSKDTGRWNEAPSRAMSKSGPVRSSMSASRSGTCGINKYPDNEALVMELLSQFLQTDSINFIQKWLVGASEREKALVCDMIKTAMMTEQQMAPDQWKMDEFLENDHVKQSGGQVDRLVVDQQPMPTVAEEQIMTPLPDINQRQRSGSRLCDLVTKNDAHPSSAHPKFDMLAPVTEYDQDV